MSRTPIAPETATDEINLLAEIRGAVEAMSHDLLTVAERIADDVHAIRNAVEAEKE